MRNDLSISYKILLPVYSLCGPEGVSSLPGFFSMILLFESNLIKTKVFITSFSSLKPVIKDIYYRIF